MSRARVTAFALALVLGGCIPPADEVEPRGAGGVRTKPSPATRGEPFRTDDGWTVTIEQLYLRTAIYVQSTLSVPNPKMAYEEFVWNARSPQELWAPGVPAGPAAAELELTSGYVRSPFGPRYGNDEVYVDVPADVVERYQTREDIAQELLGETLDERLAPTVVLVATGERDGVRVTVDVAFSTTSFARQDGEGRPLDIVKNELRLVPLRVVGEALFRYAADGQTLFQPIADADAASVTPDGRVTAEELARTRLSCPDGSGAHNGATRCHRSILDLLRVQTPAVIDRPPLEEVGGRDPRDDFDFGQAPEAKP